MSKYRYSKENSYEEGFWYAYDRETGDFICNVWERNKSGRRRWVAENGDIWGCGATRDKAVDDYLIAKDWKKWLKERGWKE